MIVIPDRETPGMSARLCAKPTATPCFSVRSSIDRVIGRRSAQPRSRPNPARKIAICHGSPMCSAMKSSSRKPITPAGIVAATTTHAIRSSVVAIERRRSVPSHATTRPFRSCQKYATTATSVPR